MYKLESYNFIEDGKILDEEFEFNSLTGLFALAKELIKRDEEIVEVNSIHSCYKFFQHNTRREVKVFQTQKRVVYVKKV